MCVRVKFWIVGFYVQREGSEATLCILQHTSMHGMRSVWERKERTASSSSSGRARRKVDDDPVSNCTKREERSS